jgi:hypothetical protein
MNKRVMAEQEHITLSQLAEQIPGRPCYGTVRRWAITGAKAVSGEHVLLPTIKLPGGLGSSVQKYDEFVTLLNQ